MMFSVLALALQPAAAPPPPNDYGLEQNWLCRPDRRDACTIDREATNVDADGTLQPVEFEEASDPGVDCFYVYPTVSLDSDANSDMVANDEERGVIAAQFARFGSVCRLYAPQYRQVTIPALRALMAGQPIGGDRELIYNDVKQAFDHYIAHDNGGRPFVLYGHSQGAGILKQLVQNEIDGKPLQQQMLSAMLIGTNVAVPEGKDVGGDFQSVPLCRSADQTACVVSYVSFRADAPPPPNSRFGKAPAAGQQIACTNPAALAGTRSPVIADATLLDRQTASSSSAPPPAWTVEDPKLETLYVKVPGLISTQCTRQGDFTYLGVTVNADPDDARTDEIAGDVLVNGTVLGDWGLHLVDVNVVEGNLTALIASQAAAKKDE